MIQGVTLDLWDTIIVDDSDEPLRRERGMPSKWDARMNVVMDALGTCAPHVTRDRLGDACAEAAQAFRTSWREQHVTFGVGERLDRITSSLGVALRSDVHDATVRALEEMELDPAPVLVAGADAGIVALARRWPIAIVSDAVFSPGRCLRAIVDGHGLLGHFGTCVFSDEVGRSKPHRDVFVQAADALAVPIASMVHVGDREHHDIRGAKDAGMKAVLFTGSRSDDRDRTTADAVCESWDELPAIIESL